MDITFALLILLFLVYLSFAAVIVVCYHYQCLFKKKEKELSILKNKLCEKEKEVDLNDNIRS